MKDLNITKEDVLELAATKVADTYFDQSEIESSVHKIVEQRVAEYIGKGLQARIDKFLDEEMSKLLAQEITPVDIWGEKAGKPTTIRAQLAERARVFWDVCVDKDGKESSWGGEPRHAHLMKRIAKEEFEKAVKSNADVIVGQFKEALKADAAKLVAEHIDKLITVKTR